MERFRSRPTSLSFATTTSDTLRLTYDASEIYARSREHGWLHEVAVYHNSNAVPVPTTLLLGSSGLAGLACLSRRRPVARQGTTDR